MAADTNRDSRIISWDWREQPDVIAIAAAALTMRTASGDVYLTMVDTGTDEYAVCISAMELVPGEIDHAWRQYMEEER